MGNLLPDILMAELRRRYAEPQRHYHTWAHIEALLLLFEEVRGQLSDAAVVEAAPWPVFSANEAAIRRECAFVEEAAYRHGRRRVLESFLQRERLYLSAHFAPRLDKPARENLGRNLSALS